MRLCKNRTCKATLPNGSKLRHCSDACGEVLAMQAVHKRRAQIAKAKKREQRAKENAFKANSHSYQFQLTKKAAQKLANRLDAGMPCICCDEPRGKDVFCGGHAKSAGAHPEMALDLRNIHGQRNKHCNKEKSGNWAGDKHSKGYRQGLIDRYGQAMVDYLESYHPPRKWTGEELIALRKLYAAETRRIESGQPPSRDWRALDNSAAMPQECE